MNQLYTPTLKEIFIVVFGSITCDLIYWPNRKEEVIRGGKNKADRIEFAFGGFGLDVAIALKHAFPEFKVILNSSVGNHKIWNCVELWDQILRPYLEKEGVELAVHVVEGERINVSIIEASGDERTIFTESSPKTYFKSEYIAWNAIKQANMAIIGHLGVDVTEALIHSLYASGALVVFNPGRTQITSYSNQPGVFGDISKKVFVLQMNSQEARSMLDMSHASKTQLLSELVKRGEQRITVLTDGERGAIVYDRQLDIVIEHPACSVQRNELLDPTGVGDHYVGVLAGAWLESEGDLKYALYKASIYAAESTLHAGGSGGQLRQGEEAKFLDTHPFKEEVRIRNFAELKYS